MFTLEILKKVREGTLTPSRPRDIAEAAPLITTYAYNYPQPDVIMAMMDALLLQAQASSHEHARDVYWHTLEGLSSNIYTEEGRPLRQWILSEYAKPRFKPHTAKEVDQRHEELQALQNQPNKVAPVQRHSADTHFLNVMSILRRSFDELDEPTALLAASIIIKDFPRELRDEIRSSTVKVAGTLLGLDIGGLVRHEERSGRPIDVAYLKRAAAIADKVDEVLGTSGTRHELTKAGFMLAFAQGTAPAVKRYLLARARELPLKEKQKIVDHYTECKEQEHPTSPCKTIEGYSRRTVMYTHDAAEFDAFVQELERWNKDYRSHDFSKQYFAKIIKTRDAYSEEKLATTGLYDEDSIIRFFDPRLKWPEIARRLEMMRGLVGRPNMKPFSLDENAYLRADLNRALKFGHADDLRAALEYCQALAPDVKLARRFENEFLYGFPNFGINDRISRSPAVVQTLIDFIPASLWASKHGSDVSLMGKMLTVPGAGDFDRLNRYDCAYTQDGLPLSREEAFASQRLAFAQAERLLTALPPKESQALLDEITETEHYFSLFKDCFHSMASGEDPQAIGNWVRLAYKFHSTERAREFVSDLVRSVTAGCNKPSQLAVTAGFFQAIKDCDPDPNYFSFLMAKSLTRGEALKAAAITHAMDPQLLPLDRDSPEVALIKAYLKKINDHPQEGLATLDHQVMVDFGLTRNPNLPNPHFCRQLFHELEPFMEEYAKREEAGYSHDRTQRLAHLFSTFRQVDTFFRHHAQPTRRPVHDLCEFQLPQGSHDWDKQLWGNLAIRYGHPVLRLLPFAPKIEAYFKEHIEPINERRRDINRNKLGKVGQAVHDRVLELATMKPAMLRTIAARVGYSRGAENPLLAAQCVDMGIEEKFFEETLQLTSKFAAAAHDPKKDRMPALTVDGYKLGLDGYRLERIPHGDFLNLWIGKIVNCCNHLAGDSRDMALKQFSGPDNALYVIRDRRNRPIAKFSGWLTKQGNIVFNAWERKSDQEDFLLTRFALAAAIEVLKVAPKVQRVLLGAGSLNPHSLPFKLAHDAEQPKKDAMGTFDARKQFILAERHNLASANDALTREVELAPQRGQVRIKLTFREMDNLGLLRN